MPDVGQAGDLRRIEEVAGDGLDARPARGAAASAGSEKRDDGDDAALHPGRVQARRTRRASDGPILPPAPSTSTSPVERARERDVGGARAGESSSSSCASSSIADGQGSCGSSHVTPVETCDAPLGREERAPCRRRDV